VRKTLHKAAFRFRERFKTLFVSALRRMYWQAQGLSVGQGTPLPKIYVTWPHQVRLGARCAIEPNIRFKYDGIYARGPTINIGDDVFIGANCEFNIRNGLSIGNHCLIASNCYVVDHDHGFSTRALPMAVQSGGGESAVVIENDVWIGANVVVLKGVRIGMGAIVAAGSVVSKSIPSFEIWGGVPAKRLRDRP
jgi:acetyltransferase-like isoleucine patch superfamily enzyme